MKEEAHPYVETQTLLVLMVTDSFDGSVEVSESVIQTGGTVLKGSSF